MSKPLLPNSFYPNKRVEERNNKSTLFDDDEVFEGAVSYCCEAPVMIGSICSECGDPCEIIEIEEEIVE